jgi:hypothetical protein
MRYVLLVVALLAVGCGKEIGDECVVSSDCSPNGDRFCDTSSQGGYCTVQGCNFDSCPEESVCVRFFTGNFNNRVCDPTLPPHQAGCTLDELCSLVGSCVPRSAEIRFCMRKCDDDGDCRDGYECRDIARMIEHGGEPVLDGLAVTEATAPKFCASAP